VDKISVCSFNCHGIKTSVGKIVDLMRQHEILACQETWLMNHDIPFRVPECFSHSVSAVDETQQLLRGRPYGGLSFVWTRKISRYVRVVSFQDCRFLGLVYEKDNITIMLINVYLYYTKTLMYVFICLSAH
jgi:hypothetical protein